MKAEAGVKSGVFFEKRANTSGACNSIFQGEFRKDKINRTQFFYLYLIFLIYFPGPGTHGMKHANFEPQQMKAEAGLKSGVFFEKRVNTSRACNSIFQGEFRKDKIGEHNFFI